MRASEYYSVLGQILSHARDARLYIRTGDHEKALDAAQQVIDLTHGHLTAIDKSKAPAQPGA